MFLRRLFCFWLIISFISTLIIPPQKLYAQTVLGLPAPGTMVNLSHAYTPLLIKGLKVHPENPLLFDFIMDTGNDPRFIVKNAEKLIKYFLATLTIPEKDLWVNLSPYEKDRMIPDELGQTELGRDMLAQDYVLKQLTASLIYPEKNLGKEFWDRVYTKAQEQYGSRQIPVNTFNKVWILADKANVYVHDNTAFVVGAHLKVMLEEDYLALKRHSEGGHGTTEESKGVLSSIASKIIRQIILPEIEKEVNGGKNFSSLRQIFYSMILATWYKKNLKEALLNQVYTDRSKVNGVDVPDKGIKEKIYQQYLRAYKKGVFNYIKEDINQASQERVPHKYFSGGEVMDLTKAEKEVPISPEVIAFSDYGIEGHVLDVRTAVQRTANPSVSLAMMTAHQITAVNDGVAAVLGEQMPGGQLYRGDRKLAGMAFIFGTGNNGTAADQNGNILTYGNVLMELGHNIVRRIDGTWEFRGRQAKGGKAVKLPGETSFEENFSGLNLARRFMREGWIRAILDPLTVRDLNNISEIIGINIPDTEVEKKQQQKEAVDEVLRAVSTVVGNGQPGSARLIHFVDDIGQDIGQALATVFIEYHRESWVENFILVSGVGENLARINGRTGDNDILVGAIRRGVANGLRGRRRLSDPLSDARIKRITDGIRRSTMNWQREALAAAFTAQEKSRLPADSVAVGVSIGGTKIGAIAISIGDRLLGSIQVEWTGNFDPNPEAFTRGVVLTIRKALSDAGIDPNRVNKIKIAFAGPVNMETGVVGEEFTPPNLPFLRNVPLTMMVLNRWNEMLRPTRVQELRLREQAEVIGVNDKYHPSSIPRDFIIRREYVSASQHKLVVQGPRRRNEIQIDARAQVRIFGPWVIVFGDTYYVMDRKNDAIRVLNVDNLTGNIYPPSPEGAKEVSEVFSFGYRGHVEDSYWSHGASIIGVDLERSELSGQGVLTVALKTGRVKEFNLVKIAREQMGINLAMAALMPNLRHDHSMRHLGRRPSLFQPPTLRGGIDLNSRNMQMDVSGDKIDISLNPAMITQFQCGDFTGVHAVIVGISTIPSVLPLMGLTGPLPNIQ